MTLEIMTKQDGISNHLMDLIATPENLKEACAKVYSNKGAAGIDGMNVYDLESHIAKYGRAILDKLKAGTYQPQMVKRVYIPKDNGDKRALGIPVVRDRVVQQMILNILDPMIDPSFSDYSYGFRKGRSAHNAIRQVESYINEGYTWVVNCDLSKYFDTVNHQKLMSLVRYYVKDKRVIKILWAFLEAGILEDGLVKPSLKGTPQGGVISPLLSNIYLNMLDRELEKRGHRFVRYADDFSIYVKSPRAGERVMESITRYLEEDLRLVVNREKSRVVSIYKMKLLGFGFGKEAKTGKLIAVRIGRQKRSLNGDLSN